MLRWQGPTQNYCKLHELTASRFTAANHGKKMVYEIRSNRTEPAAANLFKIWH